MLVVLAGQEEGSLIFMLRQDFPSALVVTTALHTSDILSIRFMWLSQEWFSFKRRALSRVNLWNFLPF